MRLSNPPVPYVSQGDFRKTPLRMYHDTTVDGAHLGRDKKVRKTKKCYFWSSMHKDINNYIKTCLPCAQFSPR